MALSLFLLTAVSTTVVGARIGLDFQAGQAPFSSPDDLFPFLWAWRHPGLVTAGLGFSLPLLAILLAHELGHFIACRRHGLDATLPYFLPAPTLLGTMGAFIRIRSPFQNRRELLDVGMAGPLAGLAVTLPLLWEGLAQSRWLSTPAPQGMLGFGWPPLAVWVLHDVHPYASFRYLLPSPLAYAAWAGLFVTTLNLLPAAQLDGGHSLYALAPRLHRPVSWAMVAVLLWLGWRAWPGWYVWAGFILLMRARHPPVWDGAKLGVGRALIAWLGIALLLATFLPTPVWAN